MKDNKKRLGKFYVSKEFFTVPPTPLIDFLAEINVRELNHLNEFGRERYEIIAEFDEFDEIKEGENIPEYCIIFENTEDGGVRRLPVERYAESPIFDYGAFDRR